MANEQWTWDHWAFNMTCWSCRPINWGHNFNPLGFFFYLWLLIFCFSRCKLLILYQKTPHRTWKTKKIKTSLTVDETPKATEHNIMFNVSHLIPVHFTKVNIFFHSWYCCQKKSGKKERKKIVSAKNISWKERWF